jgi:glycosyltransferase involved in cell wall biosynthesis
MIVPGRTGFLADKVSPESLHGALTSVLSDPSRLRGMREESRKTAEVVWRPQSLLEQFEEVAGAVVSGW